MEDAFKRIERLLGSAAMDKLKSSDILLFGVGGVGSFVAEALVRSGIGNLTIVDNDDVCVTNINRQIHATVHTVGRPKTEVMKERLLSINPECNIRTIEHFYLPDDDGGIIKDQYDYIIDAIDTVSAKIDIVIKAQALDIPIISCMGTGNKLHPERLELADIYKTSVCPLCRVMRTELKKRGVKKLRVVYSKEQPIVPKYNEEQKEGRKRAPGSTAFVPSAAGLIIASEVVNNLTQDVI